MSSYYFYYKGMSNNHSAHFILYSDVFKAQHECIKNNDAECTQMANQLVLETLAMHAEGIVNSPLAMIESTEYADDYLSWYSKVENEK